MPQSIEKLSCVATRSYAVVDFLGKSFKRGSARVGRKLVHKIRSHNCIRGRITMSVNSFRYRGTQLHKLEEQRLEFLALAVRPLFVRLPPCLLQ